MKIGLLTFHSALNIGAQLQCLALFSKLKDLGHEVEIINYSPYYLKKPYEYFCRARKEFGILSVIKQVLYTLFTRSFPKWYKTISHYKNFQGHYLKISDSIYKNSEDFGSSDYDGFIVGSDQIWNPEITNIIDPFYTLSFAKGNKKKIAYAASFSEKHISHDQTKDLIGRISDFDAISVREPRLKEYLCGFCSLNISVNLDPTLLLKRVDWLKFIDKTRLIKDKYILIYQARGPKEPLELMANKIGNKIGVRYVNASGMNYQIKKNGMQYVSPVEFLNLVYYSELVITASFHGTALSVILEKPFYSIRVNDGRDGRVEDLLSSIDLSYCLKDINDDIDYMPNIDFSEVEKNLCLKRSESISFLKDNLK